jgi:hypothetical protein
MKIEFTVHVENILEFAEVLGVNEMENKIKGITLDEELIIDVTYNKSDRDIIEELENLAVSDDE